MLRHDLSNLDVHVCSIYAVAYVREHRAWARQLLGLGRVGGEQRGPTCDA